MPNYQILLVFRTQLKQNRLSTALVPGMKQHCILAQGVWYEIRTIINNREPRNGTCRHFSARCSARRRSFSPSKLRGLRVEDDRVSFYINAVDGVAAILLNRGQPLKKNCSGFEKFEKNHSFLRFFRMRLKHVRS
jgi:hypothetical protein